MHFRPPIPRSLTLVVALGAVAMMATTSVVIQPGTTLTQLAASHDVTVAELVEWNNIADPDRIVAGDTLQLQPPAAAEPEPTPLVGAEHIVTAGDTLWLIARRYGATVAAIVEANNLSDPNQISIDQRLVVEPATDATTTGEPAVSPPPAARSHEVAAGDTIFSVSKRYGVSPAALTAANGIIDDDVIRIGELLTIPTGAGSQPSQEPNPPTSRPTAPAAELPANATPLKDSFIRWSSAYGIPQDLLEALMWKESNWQPSITGPNGHLGIGQLSPDTAAFVQERLLGLELNPLDASDGVQLSARYLRYLLDRTNSEREGLAAWNQGIASVIESGISDAGGTFADQVLEIRRIRG